MKAEDHSGEEPYNIEGARNQRPAWESSIRPTTGGGAHTCFPTSMIGGELLVHINIILSLLVSLCILVRITSIISAYALCQSESMHRLLSLTLCQFYVPLLPQTFSLHPFSVHPEANLDTATDALLARCFLSRPEHSAHSKRFRPESIFIKRPISLATDIRD